MIYKLFRYFAIERPAAQKDVSQWISALEQSGHTILNRASALSDSENNRRVLSHIIGIERWGSRRLQVVLGEAFVADEYNVYRPAQDTSWDQLQAEFEQTRAKTVGLLQQVQAEKADLSQSVQHNQLGELTAKGWMRYLFMHGDLEAKKLR